MPTQVCRAAASIMTTKKSFIPVVPFVTEFVEFLEKIYYVGFFEVCSKENPALLLYEYESFVASLN
jgi:hypothetical protein